MTKQSKTFQRKYKPYGRGGWFYESPRHSLAAKGVKTKVNFPVWKPDMKSVGKPMDLKKLDKPYLALMFKISKDQGDKKEMKRITNEWVKRGYTLSAAGDLEPQYDSRKSFYGKANQRMEDGKLILRSYSTDVAYIKDGKAYVNGLYSDTTTRHIKEFLKQNGFKVESSDQIIKDYGRKEEKVSVSAPVTKSSKPSMYHTSIGTTFDIGDGIKVVAQTGPSRDGFNHYADVYKDGQKIGSAKAHYINRTWESYDFETVIKDALDNAGISESEKEKILGTTKNLSIGKIDEEFKSVATVAKLGDIFGKTKKEKNDWKLRMIKAGLGNKGLSIPEDWDTLSEDTKEARLDGIIKMMRKDKKNLTAKGKINTGQELMGATQHGTPKPSGEKFVRFIPNTRRSEAIVKDEFGKSQLYVRRPGGHAGYHLILDGDDFEFVRSI